ncbi:hypothetical protein CAMGR0001_0417 [Campylobacter gracilis RM3268]|uniref:Uncharacterized protein n=1 Tax=Campylobacter gracilis RM3268 TaxID=553220 RepID=C8PHH2_9BACT|nr:hypothetical protein CAMGR0001_0417 [Campylobacter gracilis RM3268]
MINKIFNGNLNAKVEFRLNFKLASSSFASSFLVRTLYFEF